MGKIITPDGGFYLDDSQFIVDYNEKLVQVIGSGGTVAPGTYLPLTGGQMKGPLILEDGGIAISNLSLGDVIQESINNIGIANNSYPGLVKSSDKQNYITVFNTGEMEVNSVNTNKLVQNPGDELVLQNGNSQIV